MAGMLEALILFMKIMFCGAGAIISIMVFCIVAYAAAIVIKSALQAAFQGVAERLLQRQQEKDKRQKEKQKGKKKA